MSDVPASEEIESLFDNNRRWASDMQSAEPEFFANLADQQKPRYLWIGCSDSRVPASQVLGLLPGDVFEHRNVANVVLHADLNCMSVVDFAIRQLRIRHIIVCGHYGCAGVKAAMQGGTDGVVDHWLSGIRELWEQNRDQCAGLDLAAAQARMCELNVQHQVRSVCQTTVLKQAWSQGQAIDVHGWIYGVADGLLRDLGVRVSGPTDF